MMANLPIWTRNLPALAPRWRRAVERARPFEIVATFKNRDDEVLGVSLGNFSQSSHRPGEVFLDKCDIIERSAA